MNLVSACRSRWLLPAQSALAAGLMAAAALMPPAKGAILIVSLRGNDREAVRTWIQGDGRLLGAGPLPHSLVVVGRRGLLARAAWRNHSVILAGVFAGCGETSAI